MIPFLDLKAQYRGIATEISSAVSSVFENAQFVLGEAVAGFERECASYVGVEHAIGVNSGTSALHLALLAAGVGPGDEVVTVPFTFVATVAAILYAGARPVFVDVDPESLTMDPGRLEAAITPRTKAVIPVHLYGQAADMDPILEIAQRRGVAVIEDAAQAIGAQYKGRRAGSMGDLGCFSFYPGKNLGACGEGGMVVTGNADYARVIRMLRDWGQDVRYHHVLKGFNYRLEGLQGAILRVKLAHLDDWTERRRAHAACYDALFDRTGVPSVREMAWGRHVYHIYAIRSTLRDSLRQALQRAGVETGLHYPIPVHLQPAYADLGYKEGDFPHAERAAREVLSLPMFPELTSQQVQAAAGAVLEACHAA
jgi:dTDP-4-amino-4,6-dideoxygalactose transaminase